MSEYGPVFDELAAEWRVIENTHDREHPDRDQCGGVGGCTMMRVATQLEQDMVAALEVWRIVQPAEPAKKLSYRQGWDDGMRFTVDWYRENGQEPAEPAETPDAAYARGWKLGVDYGRMNPA